jgi:hypothetical protein
MIGTAQMKMVINNGDDYQLMVIIIRQLVESMCLSHEQKLMCIAWNGISASVFLQMTAIATFILTTLPPPADPT